MNVDIIELVPTILISLIIINVILVIIYTFVIKKDDKKELITRKVKIIEKPVQQGNIEWYIVECENGERIKLRSVNANSIFISVGDVGFIKYKGITIQDFQRQ